MKNGDSNVLRTIHKRTDKYSQNDFQLSQNDFHLPQNDFQLSLNDFQLSLNDFHLPQKHRAPLTKR